MTSFETLDNLADRLIDEEIQGYDLPYYIEPLLEEGDTLSLLKDYLSDAITHKNADRIECGLILAGELGYDKPLLSLYEPLLLDDWHHSHEDIVYAIATFGNISNVPTLQKAFNLSLPYMEYDHHYSFHRKMLYGIQKLAPKLFPIIYKQVKSKLCVALQKESFK
ncbi:MAG: hypothetical protein Q3983_00940 [Capnocytophaga sp.]|nr:hypothetical protein [Capnocytophaga sp.]